MRSLAAQHQTKPKVWLSIDQKKKKYTQGTTSIMHTFLVHGMRNKADPAAVNITQYALHILNTILPLLNIHKSQISLQDITFSSEQMVKNVQTHKYVKQICWYGCAFVL